jgi:hypothetical protein
MRCAIVARNDQLVEVVKKRVAEASFGEEPRHDAFTGKEHVVRGDLAGLKDGQDVSLSQKP